jgi:glycosyltransferase involved in cell wall biosynthesis
MSKISACLATFNEEKNIADCLESVKWVDEIVLVDGTSNDRTVEIAKKYTSKIIVRENPLMFHLNKQKAFEAATGDWILYLDADERVTPELRDEIVQVTSLQAPVPAGPFRRSPSDTVRGETFNGFWIPRKNIIFGKWIKHSLWYPDYQLRLFKRGKAFLPCKSVHEQPKLSGQAGYLKNPLIHYNYQTISQYIKKLNELYTENDAKILLAKKKKLHWYEAIRLPTRDFLSTFFARQGYKDGLHGLVLSLLQAFSALITFAKAWEAQGFRQVEDGRFLEKVERELTKGGEELRYWFLTSRINEESSFLRKLALKIKRRLGRVL